MTISKTTKIIAAGAGSMLFVQLFGLTPLQKPAERLFGAITLPAAQASTSARPKLFVPNSRRGRPAQSVGAGSRGCEHGDLVPNTVKLLIPSEEVAGQTSYGRPQFFLHLSKSVSAPLKFTLIEDGVNEPLYETQIDAPPSGIVKIEIPKDVPELATNGIYKWSVSLVCNVKRPSANPLFYSWVERVPTTPELEQAISAAQTDLDRARVYASAGLWYEALALLHEAQATHPEDPAIQADFQTLLSEVGLTEVARR
ncbi:DUF928 domain-containing protein [Lusitaniella coriacea LEGE 07157]|uniref:DUF928 domain-containing protein n=1 Tax=Lusitaniella coriacea LEGE 07157 TaxID=945747 RepID=A0A8J7DV58_9CYAN|nr:DUF928 domain-containing protein [Lusitaniella coriacea]MBE9115587.1 DUF928 domain-containing protein [Lusitaniella coriacea LEGE 07157]